MGFRVSNVSRVSSGIHVKCYYFDRSLYSPASLIASLVLFQLIKCGITHILNLPLMFKLVKSGIH